MAINNDHYLVNTMTNAVVNGVCIFSFCGWIRAVNLVTGHANDLKYTEFSQKYYQYQRNKNIKNTRKNDNNKVKPFLNVLDKGYRITMIAKQYEQTMLTTKICYIRSTILIE